ncbi:hypothetical protein C0J50_23164 [Silurus asotus]|uniref:Chemokine interleukin-8-like domain-containing protein n=1 Tax=Silurus asotus TaxID=30991 RepID=A0AAD5FIT6_SILAS|nr:hypothetical protein C0J50_23164 [Silurus asotus]
MSRVFLVLGFILIMALYSEAKPESIEAEGCCFKFFESKIPPSSIKEVKKTGSHCPQQGFICRCRTTYRLLFQVFHRKNTSSSSPEGEADRHALSTARLRRLLVVNGLHSRSFVIHSYTCNAENMTSRVNLILGFTLISALYSNAQPFSLYAVPCCFRFFKGKIPAERILKVEKTNSHCTMHGFMLYEGECEKKDSDLFTFSANICNRQKPSTSMFSMLGDKVVPDPLPVPCCFKFFSGKIPPRNILKVKKTDSQCTQQGFM